MANGSDCWFSGFVTDMDNMFVETIENNAKNTLWPKISYHLCASFYLLLDLSLVGGTAQKIGAQGERERERERGGGVVRKFHQIFRVWPVRPSAVAAAAAAAV